MKSILIFSEGVTYASRSCDMAKEITESIVRNTGAEANSISVIFEEVAQADWAVGGNLSEDHK
jgi:4-oxalocrotonate tautomerase